MERIKKLQQAFSEVDPTPIEKWVDDFKRDLNPDRELSVWEGMATAYTAFTKGKTLSADAKKDVFQVVLLRSGAPETEVLKNLSLKVLAEADAKEIMSRFSTAPAPLKVYSP